MLAARALTTEEVLLLEGQLSSGDVFDPLIDIADGDLVSCCYGPTRNYVHAPAIKNCHSVRPATVIDQVGWPIKPCPSPQ